MKGLFCTIKLALVLAVIVLAFTGTFYVLDIFTTEAAKEILIKVMNVLGIWTAASLVLLIITTLGNKST